MTSLWFCVPAHGRQELAAICLRQLRRTCDSLIENGIEASAVVIADDENLDTAKQLGFATVVRDNQFLSKKYNDGCQLALDRQYNPHPADFVVMCGSDDFVDYRILLDLPPADTVLGFQHVSFVRDDGREMTSRHLNNLGGCGIRIYPHHVMKTVGFRPADEDRKRACDTSIITNLSLAHGDALRVVHGDIDPRSIVDWKSPDQQLNPYETLSRHKRGVSADPFEALADVYPAEALAEMRAHYEKAPTRSLVAA